MTIKIPDIFEQKLRADDEWRYFVYSLAEKCETIFQRSPVFFPEYTFHGVTHVNRVMEMASLLMEKESINKLSPMSIAVLLSSIIVHDIGMFIDKDGLNKVLYGEYKDRKTDLLDEMDWENTWKTYYKRVTRYDERKLVDTFGSSEPIIKLHRLDSDELSEKDKKVYGEFIRQNHHRLSHEFVVHGIYGYKDVRIFDVEKYEYLVKNIGVVVRSHRLKLRDLDDYLVTIYGADDGYKMPIGIPIYYLMAILRLADHIDAGEERSPKNLEDIQRIKSQVSLNEWGWNQTLNYNQSFTWITDKRKLIIYADPKDSDSFIRVEKWINKFQEELDRSNAILMEYYTNIYRLSISRVDSNIIDSKSKEIFKGKFVTEKIELKINNDIAKLFIIPLYNNQPSYGIRELIQNSVDACNEREAYEKNNSYIGNIIVSLDTNNNELEINDNGIGMNLDVIKNYYMTIGASYRLGDNWIMNHVDEHGKNKTTRIGRFGIGSLAGFLLGKEITIHTQHLNEKNGYKFSLNMGSKDIQIIVERREQGTGTSIRIKLYNSTIKTLISEPLHIRGANDVEWYEWYGFDKPVIKYFLDNKEVKKNTDNIMRDSEKEDKWYVLDTSEVNNYKYRFDIKPRIYYNGMLITENQGLFIGDFGFELGALPSISIIDNEERVGLSLLRNRIEIIPNLQLLAYECFKYIIFKLLSDRKNLYNSITFFDGIPRYLICRLNEFTLFERTFTEVGRINKVLTFKMPSTSDIKNILIYNFNRKERINSIIKYAYNIPICIEMEINHLDWNTEIIDINNDIYDKSITPISEIDYLDYDEKNIELKILLRDGIINKEQYKKLNSKDGMDTIFSNVRKHLNYQHADIISFKGGNYIYHNIMKEALMIYLHGDVWIPYEYEERKKKYPKAFEEMKKYGLGLD